MGEMNPHIDPGAFREALQYTAKKTGFLDRLVEKDYYCSLILRQLYSENRSIVFKGGTLLNKVHAGFYRLSEDLDFTISTSHDAKRSERSKSAAPLKNFIGMLPKHILGLRVVQPLTGSNESVQYNAEILYQSVTSGGEDRILFEIGLREEVLEKDCFGLARTLAADPYSDKPLIPEFRVRCLSLKEAFAEKIRAALSRKRGAIRDIYDVWHALDGGIISLDDTAFAEMAAQKMSIPEKLTILTGKERREEFRKQLETQLKPVLRAKDFEKFNFDFAWSQIEKMAISVEKHLNI